MQHVGIFSSLESFFIEIAGEINGHQRDLEGEDKGRGI